jgi:hypothetical protein
VHHRHYCVVTGAPPSLLCSDGCTTVTTVWILRRTTNLSSHHHCARHVQRADDAASARVMQHAYFPCFSYAHPQQRTHNTRPCDTFEHGSVKWGYSCEYSAGTLCVHCYLWCMIHMMFMHVDVQVKSRHSFTPFYEIYPPDCRMQSTHFNIYRFVLFRSYSVDDR